MGLQLRLNLFRDVDAPDVFGALSSFYGRHGATLVAKSAEGSRWNLHVRDGRWCVLEWDSGWEWKLRRQAQLFVSARLGIAGLLVFAVDGQYWGYELFSQGVVRDRFVQKADAAERWFPAEACLGNAAVLAEEAGVPAESVEPYLVQSPLRSCEAWNALNVPARPEDAYTRFDPSAVHDFLRALGVDARFEEAYLRFGGEIWRSFSPRFPKDR